MRLRLNVLGPINVAIAGDNHGARITQPRLLALLSYLVLARPRGLHSRDTLIALLWPDADQAAGRQGLRNALHRLRAALGDGVIVTAGEGFAGVDPALIECDALEFEAAISSGQWADAVAMYRGELLQGFHVGGAPEFERWLDHERAHLTSAAAGAAWSAADTYRKRGDLSAAVRAARRASVLAPDDEVSVRRYLELLDEAGDRPAAIRVYEDFSEKLRTEFQVEPSDATRNVITRIRGVSPATMEPGRDAPRPAPRARSPRVTRWHAVKRRRTIAIGSVALGLAIVSLAWLGVRPGAAPTTGDTPGADLAEHWRADTALFSRYLHGLALIDERKVVEAREAFHQLTTDARLYAPGWAGLANAYYRSSDLPPVDALNHAQKAARTALALDNTLARAHEALIAYDLWSQWDLEAAKRNLDVALVLHPFDPGLNNLLGTWHRWLGDFDQSLEIKSRIAHADPLSVRHVWQEVNTLYWAHRCDEAADKFAKLPEEQRRVGDQVLYNALVCANRLDEAAMALRDEVLASGDSALAAALTAALTPPLNPARRDSATREAIHKRLAREFEKRRRGWSAPSLVMRDYAELRNADSTLAWLDSMRVEKDMMLQVVPFDPLMDFLRNDPRYDAFLRTLPWIGPAQQRLVDSLRLATHR